MFNASRRITLLLVVALVSVSSLAVLSVSPARAAGSRFTVFGPTTDPSAITTGPDGALWFTIPRNNAIGRVTTAGVSTQYTRIPKDLRGIEHLVGIIAA